MQALPVGNGRLGAMIFGQPQGDRLQLNEVTIWSGGGPQPDADRKDAYESLPELRLNGGSARLRCGPRTRDVKLAKGEIYRWNGQ